MLSAIWAISIGCGGGLFVKKPFVTPTLVEIPGSTNTVEDPKTGNVQVTVTPPQTVTNWVTNLVMVVNPNVDNAIETARQVNQVANPTPFAPAVTGGLTVLSVILAWVAKLKNDKARLLPILIQGIEVANEPKVKEAIRNIAVGAGLEKQLNPVVKEVTG